MDKKSVVKKKPQISSEKISELMKRFCGGNYNRFARELGVDPSHLHRFLKTGAGGGKKVIFGIAKFCKEKEVDFYDYLEM